MNTDRRKTGALIACLAAPITGSAALSGSIARNLGTSQASLLVADGVAVIVLLVILAVSRRRGSRT
jgi:hypothetical protein